MNTEDRSREIQAPFLRQEAKPVRYVELGSRQRDAFRRILFMLRESVLQLDGASASAEAMPSWMVDNRSSRIAFLSGARGTGKTTAMLSLAFELAEASRTKPDSKRFHPEALDSDGAAEKEAALRVSNAVNDVANRVVWLEPLDIEATPDTANLLAAILARVDSATRRNSEPEKNTAPRRMQGLFERGSDFQDALAELSRLQTDVALAWDGNLDSRAGHLDPDVYAVEVMRAERARLSLFTRMAGVLDKIADSVAFSDINMPHANNRGPIFVLPIDDFDINASMCLPILRLMRMILVPRLFGLVLGDVGIARYMLNMKVAGDMVRATHHADPRLLPIIPEDVGAAAGEIASNALRKLVPPNQRVHLEQHSARQGLNFRPLGKEVANKLLLHELLEEIKLELEVLVPNVSGREIKTHHARVAGMPIRSFRDFLLIGRFSLFESPDEIDSFRDEPAFEKNERIGEDRVNACAYSGKEFLQSPLRRLTDFWIELSNLVERTRHGKDNMTSYEMADDEEKAGLVDFLGEHCRQTLEEDRALASLDRQLVPLALGRSMPRLPDFDLLPLQVRSAPVSERRLLAYIDTERDETNYVAQLYVAGHRAWRFEKVRERQPNDVDIPRGVREDDSSRDIVDVQALLGTESASALMVYHDILVLVSEHSYVGRSRLSPAEIFSDARRPLAVVKWKRTGRPHSLARERWPLPYWQTFWEYDLFLHAWNDAIRNIGYAQQGEVASGQVERLAYVWIASATAILGGDTPKRLESTIRLTNTNSSGVGKEHWQLLFENVEKLIKENSRHTKRGERLREWAVRTVLFTLPEYGLSLQERERIAKYAMEKRQLIKIIESEAGYLRRIRDNSSSMNNNSVRELISKASLPKSARHLFEIDVPDEHQV
ncbi:hypothetical protein [Jiella marina]|uniref:hypothetical protein n=1 Tax=Jiella sp. LLJ827 TaxID=2917712 RepID=UPI00210195FF|nr:hypothetical protein [Jiella sp. LLJ827]MCQ0988814.1 hypothetical protein [Jiella sp. LLJ827]